jgi:hypothetical protein
MATNTAETEVFAVDFAQLAREVAMDIFPLKDILELHKLSDFEWARIQSNRRFQSMLADITREWNSALNTKERVRVKSATGLEAVLERYILDIGDQSIPLNQRVEAGKFLAKLGEMDGSLIQGGGGGAAFQINIQIGDVKKTVDVSAQVGKLIEAIPEDDE